MSLYKILINIDILHGNLSFFQLIMKQYAFNYKIRMIILISYRGKFSGSNLLKYITFSPHYARSNGAIEAQVKIIKNLFTKCRETNEDVHLGMICLYLSIYWLS